MMRMKMFTSFNILITIALKISLTLAVDDDVPIVLVHGINSNIGMWDAAIKFFKSNNYSNIHPFDYQRTTNELIENNSQRLYDYLLQENLKDAEIVLIGHSLGSLVVRRMVADNPSVKVAKLVTLAGPNYGAKDWVNAICVIPSPLCTDAIRQMIPGSPFLTDLNKRTVDTYTEDKLLTYAIDHDEFVPPNHAIIRTGFYLLVNDDSSFAFKNLKKIVKLDTIAGNAVADAESAGLSRKCTINDVSSSIADSRGQIEGKKCVVDGNECEINSWFCRINDAVGKLSVTDNSSSCEVGKTVCSMGFGSVGEINHVSIMNKREVHSNVLRFIQGKTEIVDAGPFLRDADCKYSRFKFSSPSGTVEWDIPNNAPASLQMQVLQAEGAGEGLFKNVPAQLELSEDLPKKELYSLRLFDPATTKLTKWSTVQFDDHKDQRKCVAIIKNNENIITDWEV